MNNQSPKITMAAVAESIGLATSTVSRALRDDPRISAAVRLKVVKAARKLGYRRDPRLGELMSHLRLAKRREYQGTLAWVTNLDPDDPEMARMIGEFHAPAVERAAQLGYKLEHFYKSGPEDSTRLGRIFTARGIHGVWASIFWEVDYAEWKWDWRKFAFIHHGAEPKARITDVVDAEDRQNIQLLFESLAARGYRRIGVATTRHLESEALFELSAGRVRFSLQRPEHPAFSPCLVPALNAEGARAIKRWIRRHEVDCIVSRLRGMQELLAGLGYRVPQDLGLAYASVRRTPGRQGLVSGINVNPDAISVTAINTLVSAVEQRGFGLPDLPRQTLVPGRWQEGATCRPMECGDAGEPI